LIRMLTDTFKTLIRILTGSFKTLIRILTGTLQILMHKSIPAGILNISCFY
jgi:hypothetical protein